MAKDDLYFRLRLPEDVKQLVQVAAQSNHRSMTAEIIARLEGSFADEKAKITNENTKLIARLLLEGMREDIKKGGLFGLLPNEKD